jgi:hypothetical protein
MHPPGVARPPFIKSPFLGGPMVSLYLVVVLTLPFFKITNFLEKWGLGLKRVCLWASFYYPVLYAALRHIRQGFSF